MSPMRSFLDTYDLPHRVPVAVRVWILMLAAPAIVIGLWFVLPHTVVAVIVVAAVAILVVFGGLARILSARELKELPPRRPMKPPSVGGD